MLAPFLLLLPLMVSPPEGTSPLQEATTQQQAQAKANAKDWPAAAKLYAELVKRNDKDAQSWFQLGFALHQQGKFEEALPAHEKAAGFAQTGRLASFNAACAASRLNQTDKAFSWLQQATQKGWGNRKLLSSDPDLESIRSDPRFKTVLPPLLEGPDLFVEKPTILHTMVGEAGGDQFGWVARAVGDLDLDGAMDFAATAPTHKGWSGAVYVYSSRSGKLLFRMDGKPGWQLGNSVEGRVDINADGVMDVIAGAPNYGSNPGHVLVASGKDGSTLFTLSAGVAGDQFGSKACGIEDLNGDGHAEIVVGAPADGPGKVYVYSGKSGELLMTLQGENPGDQFGCSIDATHSGGHKRLLVGAMRAGLKRGGRAYLYHQDGVAFGSVGVIEGDKDSANLGQYFASFLGDVDGDGIPDAYTADFGHNGKGPATGRVYVISGSTGKIVRTIDGRKVGESFGTSQATCGDVNGDGIADLCVGAWQNADVGYAAGKVYLVSGKDGSDLATWTSKQSGDTLGFDAVGIGDVNGDGNDDFLLTAAWSTVQFGRQGRVFVIAGPELRKPQ